jgi:hypothetical protein
MATEEIEISELEFTEELASDNLIPVESTTDTKATSLQILKNWLSSFFVGKTGDETIGGVKKFTSVIKSSQNLALESITNITTFEKPTQAHTENKTMGRINFLAQDSGLSMGHILTYRNTSNAVITQIAARQSIGGVTKGCTLEMEVDKDGNAFTRASNPAISSNNTQIATTSWVRSLLTGSIDLAGGYFPLPNNVLVQFGAINTQESTSVNLPQPFANNNYKVVISGYTIQATGSANYASVVNTTTTGFTVVPAKVGSFAWVAIGMK